MLRKTAKTILITTLVSSTPLALAGTQGSLTLQGTVGLELSLSVAPEAGVNDSLDLSASPNNLLVATVSEASNSSSGYKVSVQSANAGKLKNGQLDQLSYTLRYDNSNITLGNSAVVAKTHGSGGVVSDQSEVKISYTGKPATQMIQGTYSDTLTFTISAN